MTLPSVVRRSPVKAPLTAALPQSPPKAAPLAARALLLAQKTRVKKDSFIGVALFLIISVFVLCPFPSGPAPSPAWRGLPAAPASNWTTGLRDFLFTCPDGHLGLHLVHTRFLGAQTTNTSALLAATRLQLMRTFFAPSLAAQSTKKFVVYASFDPNLGPTAVKALHDTLMSVGAPAVASPKRGNSNAQPTAVDFPAVVARLAAKDPRVRRIDFLVESRMNAEDAVHYKAVAGLQQLACGGDGKSGSPVPVRLAAPQRAQLWLPSAEHEYGMAGVGNEAQGAEAAELGLQMGAMQTMVLSGREFVRNCAQHINVYSHKQHRPQDIEALYIGPECKFDFDLKKDTFYWSPPAGEVGSLCVRTAASWRELKSELHFLTRPAPADLQTLITSFHLSAAALMTTNMMLAGLEREAAALFEAKGVVAGLEQRKR